MDTRILPLNRPPVQADELPEPAADGAVWHDDDVIELAVDGDVLDLAQLERQCCPLRTA